VTLFSALAQRAGFSVDWSATDKDAYLNALTQEIDAPSKGHLDNYLEQFMREPIAHEELAAQVIKTPGLDGRLPAGDENEVVGNVDAPEVKAQYEAMLLKRGKKIRQIRTPPIAVAAMEISGAESTSPKEVSPPCDHRAATHVGRSREPPPAMLRARRSCRHASCPARS
jgi:hypothetical protein